MLRLNKYSMKIIDNDGKVRKYYDIKAIKMALGDWNINNSLM